MPNIAIGSWHPPVYEPETGPDGVQGRHVAGPYGTSGSRPYGTSGSAPGCRHWYAPGQYGEVSAGGLVDAVVLA